MTKPTIYVRDRIYIPSSTLDLNQVKEAYTRHMFKDASCQACEYMSERPCMVCESCPSYQGVIKLWKYKVLKGKPYIGLPVGDKKFLEKKCGIEYRDYKVVDLRTKAPLIKGIKFLIELRPHQKKLVKQFMQKRYGILEAPPRTGKTVLMLYIGITLGYRMILLANQHEYLQQFLWHIEGNEEEGIPKCTNLPELEDRLGKKLYGFPKTDDDFKTMQFMVMTYQSFSSEIKGKNRFDLVARNTGTVAVDECHRSGANVFASVLNNFHTTYRFGVTGTVQRKDGRHKITKLILGPVVARTTVEALTPTVFIKDTGIAVKREPKLWVYKMKTLCNSKPRNKMLVDRVVRDVRVGHSVVMPLIFVKHIRKMVSDINDAYGEPIAEAFTGGGSEKQKKLRQAILSRAKSGETKVVVGTRSLLQLGLNVPRWSIIYTAIPISNEPNYKQETSRIRTPMAGKRTPVVRLYYDGNMPASVACARNCMNHMKKFKYKFSSDKYTQEAMSFLDASVRRTRDRQYDEDAEFTAHRTQAFDEGTTGLGRLRAGRK